MQDLLDWGFVHVGDFAFSENKLQFHLESSKEDTGSYVFVANGRIVYVGITKNALYARMNGYKNPGPSQETNKRINPKITAAKNVSIYFLSSADIAKFTTLIRGNQKERQMPTELIIFERFLISQFKPIWNRY